MSSMLTQSFTRAFAALLILFVAYANAWAQSTPPPGVACVVSAGNRNAPLAPDGSYTVFGIPGNLGAIRARVSCSDGSVGQSAAGFTNPFQPATIELGPIVFGAITPVPVAINLSAPQRRLTTGQTGQLTVRAVGANGVQTDVTPRNEGTVYAISNDLMATVSDNGLVTIFPLFAPASSSRVVASATNEGSVSGTYMFILGPRGKLTGTVSRADGTTPVAGAQVSVLRLQPFEQAGSAVTNATGQFELLEVNAGPFLISVLDPATGDRALAGALIETEGEVANVALRLNGQGTVNVTVKDAVDAVVPNTVVTLTSLGAYRDTRTLTTNAQGVVSFAGVAVGDLTVSAREPITRLVGTAVARLSVNQTLPITLKLQPVASIQGVVYDVGGSVLKPGVQVRILSRERGILTQVISGSGGEFRFDTLPISDGPFTLDAFLDGRLRARVPGIVLSQPNTTVTRNITLGPVGTVTGTVRDGSGAVFAGAHVTAQSTAFLGLTFEVDADSQGRFTVLGMPVGDFELTAVTVTGRNGRALGRVNSDNETVNVDVVLADNTLIGTVFLRDGVTPAGAGVKVYLATKTYGTPPYSYFGAAGVLETTTNASGGFGFRVPSAGAYIVQAEQLLERGRSEVIAINLNPSQPLQARVVFLAKGIVSGQIRDSAGAIQPGVTVTVRTEGAFTTERSTTANAQGQYTLNGVVAGDLIVRASNTTTRLSGFSRGRLNSEGEAVTINVTLQATGSVLGRVIDADGSVIPSPVRLVLRVNRAEVASVEVPNGNAFMFDLIPIGDIEITADQLSTGNRGVATTRLLTAGDVKTIDVRMVGLGTVRVRTLDTAGAAIAGVEVTMSTRLPFDSRQKLLSNATGYAVFRVFAGDFNASGTKKLALGTLSGSASATLVANETKELPITMTSAAIGSIKGTVFRPDGVTPVGAGLPVRMPPITPLWTDTYTLTNAEGKYQFPQIIAGTYNVDALNFISQFPNGCPRDRVRGRASGVTLATQDQIVTANIQLIGQGQVRGQITDAQGAGVAGIDIRLINPDPVFGFNAGCDLQGTGYDTVTDAQGNYSYPDIPPGNFTLTAQNRLRTLRAEGASRVNFDGDIVTLDLTLISSAVTMPQTFYDANGFKFDITGTGAIAAGSNTVFASPAPDTGGLRLEVISNSIAVPFLNGDGTLGEISQNGQQVAVDEVGPSGLTVTRKILTPRAGYFSRYLETLENKTTAPITVSVRIKSHHRNSNSNPRVVDTSDGDQILSVIDPVLRDRWAVVDDQTDADPFEFGGGQSIPATGHLFDGLSAGTQVASADYSLIGTTGKLTYQWDNITVAVGAKATLMHFVLHQLDRQSAREAALRLAQLPPEAIDDLTTDERSQIRNFLVPAVSSIPPLPNLDAGLLSGKVFSGDGITPVPGSLVRFKSQHPLFGRVRTLTTNAQGAFEFRSTLDGTANNYVIPVDNFTLSAKYARSNASSSTSIGQFPAGQTSVIQNLIFNGTGDVRGTVKRHSNALLAAVDLILCEFDNRAQCQFQHTNSTIGLADSSYLMLANPPRDYFIFAQKTHPQQQAVQFFSGNRPIYGRAETTVTAGDVVVSNIFMEPTGSISGLVRDATNNPAVNATVTLYLAALPNQIARVTATDTSGRYRFSDVPLGGAEVRARDAITGAQGQATTSVSVDIESPLDLAIAPFGGITLQVKFARGVNASNARVICTGSSNCTGGQTDSNGQLNIPVPAGTYTIRAFHPDRVSAQELSGAVTATVTQPNQQVQAEIVLAAAGSVSGLIVRPDGTTLTNGFPVEVLQLSGVGNYRSSQLQTTSTGSYRAAGLGLGTYLITAYDAAQDRYADAEFEVNADGQEVNVDMTLLDNRIALPATLKDANRFSYDVQRSGALLSGDTAFNNAGVKLEVNGQAYVGETSARLEASRRQFRIAQIAPISGLQVERKIYVPRGAYFARYLEIFKNPSNAAIVANVKLSSTLAGGQVLGTSSGDTTVGNEDRWVTIDDATDEDIRIDNDQLPPSAHVFGALSGSNAPSSVAITAGTNPVLSAQWNSISVPANGSVTLMHFVVLQINRVGVASAAQRLLTLPPEVLTDLSTLERTSISNFEIPIDGQSVVAALPSLTSNVTGIAFEGDVRTAVRGARITVQSAHPLFNRVWGMRKDNTPDCNMPGTIVQSLLSLSNVTPGPQPPALGSFGLQGQLTALDSIALPEGVAARMTVQEPRGCFGEYSGHPVTGVHSRVVSVTPPIVQNNIWDTGILTGSVIGNADFQLTAGRLYRSIDNPLEQYVPIQNDATYVYPGLLPGSYDLLIDTQHPDGTPADVLRGQRTNVQVTLGQITVTDVQMQPVGRINGAAISANGEASVNARVLLSGLAANQSYDQCLSCVPDALGVHKGKRAVAREVATDSLGRFSFTAVPAGSYVMTVIDPISDARNVVNVSVLANQTVVQNVILLALGSANLSVTNPEGGNVVDAFVYLTADAVGFEKVVGRTNPQGLLTVANIPVGNYQLRVRDPRYPNKQSAHRLINGNVSSNGQINTHQARLLAFATLDVLVIDGDNAGAPVNGASVSVRDFANESTNLSTNTQGHAVFTVIGEGNYSVRATANIGGNQREEIVSGIITQAQNALTLPVNIDLRSAIVPLPVTLTDANRSDYLIQANGASSDTPTLSIDGTNFTGANSARRELARRQFVVTQNATLSGLRVSRKAFVPENGYFVRYVEVLENATNAPIVASVAVQSLVPSYFSTRDTSNGDAIVDPTDRWLSLSYTDSSGGRSYAMISAAANTTVAPTLSLSTTGNNQTATATWTALQIPANQTVELLHFAAKQINRAGGVASAGRLMQLPPESLIGLTGDDAQRIVNFTVPPNLQSVLPSLPSLLGVISGQVTEGDGSLVENVGVTVQSQNPLFNRKWDSSTSGSLRTNANGEYLLTGRIDGDYRSVAIPVDAPLTIAVQNGTGSFQTQTAVASFASGSTTLTQNLQFPSGRVEGTLTGATVVGVQNAQITAYQGTTRVSSGTVAADGSYQLRGLAPGLYRLEAVVYDNSTFALATEVSVTVPLGAAITQNFVMPANGALTGVVRQVDGAPLQTVHLELRQNNQTVRNKSAGALGVYSFSAVPPGNYQLIGRNYQNQTNATINVVIQNGQLTTQDLTFPGLGSAAITVKFARGVVAPNVRVYLTSTAVQNERDLGPTNSNGVVNATGIPVGAFSLRVRHPDTQQETTLAASIPADGANVAVALDLKASTTLRLTVLDADASNAPVAGATVRYSAPGESGVGPDTDAQGTSLLPLFKQLSYSYGVRTPNGREAVGTLLVDVSMDGQIVDRSLSVSGAVDQVGTLTFDGESRVYGLLAAQGDVLSATIASTGSCGIGVQIAVPNLYSVAGYATTFAGGTSSTANVTANAGEYAVAVFTNGCVPSDYRLTVKKNGFPVAVGAFEHSGTLVGHLYQADGTTPIPNAKVRAQLLINNFPMYRAEVMTDGSGAYSFPNVPIRDYSQPTQIDLDYVKPAGVNAGGHAEATLITVGSTVTQDLVLDATTQLNLQLRNADGSPYPRSLTVTIGRNIFTQAQVQLDAQGQASYSYIGNRITEARVVDFNSGQIAESVVTPADGQTRNIDLVLAFAAVEGVVTDPDGAIFPNARLEIDRLLLPRTYGSPSTDALGHFSFAPLPASNNLRVLVTDPVNRAQTVALFSSLGDQTVVRNVQLAGRGSITGRISTPQGQALVANVVARYSVDGDATHIFALETRSDASGNYLIANTPVGRPITVTATLNTPAATPTASASVITALVSHNSTLVRDLQIALPVGGAIVAKALDAEGEPLPFNDCAINFSQAGDFYGETQLTDCTGVAALYGVPIGVIDATLAFHTFDSQYRSKSFTLVAGQILNATIPVSVVKGVIRHGSEAAEGVNVYITDSNGDSDWYTNTASDGSYRIVGADTGAFTISAQDSTSGQTVDASGNITDAGTPVLLDLQFPAGANLSGEVRDAAGALLVGASVYLSNASFNRTVETDAQGRYSFIHAALGSYTLSAVHPQSANSVQTPLEISAAQLIVVNLSLPPGGALSGTVKAPDNAPVADALVVLSSAQAGVDIISSAQTDSNGVYIFSDVSPVQMRVSSTAGTPASYATNTQQVVAGSTATANLSLGTGASAYSSLIDTLAEHTVSVVADGSLQTVQSTIVPYRPYALYNEFRLTLGGSSPPIQGVASSHQAGRELGFGPNRMSGLQVTRRIYVPIAAGFVRSFDSLNNPTASAITVTLAISGSTTVSNIALVVAPNSTGSRYGIFAPPGPVQSYNPATVGLVFASSGATLPTALNLLDNQTAHGWSWTITIAPGETASFLNYAVLRPASAGALASVQAQALAIAEMSQPGMFDGLSAAEKASVKNFVITP